MSAPASPRPPTLSDPSSRISTLRETLRTLPPKPLRVPRVSQLDAELLDRELLGMLAEPVNKALAQVKSSVRDRWQPELSALLKLAYFSWSIYSCSSASYGSSLQNLRYRNEWAHRAHRATALPPAPLLPVQKTLHALLAIFLPYALTRLRSRMAQGSWADLPRLNPRRRVFDAVDRAEKVSELAELLSFLVFLYDGKYRSLVDRVLGMRLTYARQNVQRAVSYEFLNRQLVWGAFTEFLLFFLPLINSTHLPARISSYFSLLLPPALTPLTSTSKPTSSGPGPFAHLPPHVCAICYARQDPPPEPDKVKIGVPYITSCGCMYEYTCVAQVLARAARDGEEGWTCLRCGGLVKGAERVEGWEWAEGGVETEDKVRSGSEPGDKELNKKMN